MSEPIRLEGVKDLDAALKKFDEAGRKLLNRQINAAAREIKVDAAGYIIDQPPTGLSKWNDPVKFGPRIQSQAGIRSFPRFEAALMRRGLRIVKQKNKPDPAGWATTVAIEQKSPAGNIYEKAGIVAGGKTRPPNYSLNPRASEDFKRKMQDFYFVRKGTGRALIRAGREDAGMARTKIARARYEAEQRLQQLFNAEAVKNG